MTAFLESIADGFHHASTRASDQIQEAIQHAKPPAIGPGLRQALHQLGIAEPSLTPDQANRYADGVAEAAVNSAAAAVFDPGGGP